MSFGGLRIGSSGLAAAQRALETAAHNVANANTEGYSRQRVQISTADPLLEHRGLLGPGATGQGVSIDAVERAANALVQGNYRQSAGQLASWETRADFFGRAEQILGPLDRGVSQHLSAFFNSWEALSQAPESMTSRDQVLDAGRQLAGSLNDAYARLTDLRADVGLDMVATTTRVNALATEVATLNGQIKAARVGGDVPNDLLDRRDLALGQLAELTGARVSIESDGDARVTLNNLPIVDGVRAEPLETSGVPPTVTWAATGAPVALGGELGSLAELGGSTTDDLLARLDEIATDLRDVVNSAHQTGFGLDGVDGRDFFSGTGASDLMIDPTLTNQMLAASASGAAADGNHALAMGGLRSTVGGSGSTIGELVNGLQGVLGLEANHAESQRDLASVVVNDARRAIAEVSGVSTDEELTDMLQYQRAYEASARVITVLDEMLDRLINRTGSTR
jgi:flagellar hook-associated protein 1 FlgK